jgi:hypothetical protein
MDKQEIADRLDALGFEIEKHQRSVNELRAEAERLCDWIKTTGKLEYDEKKLYVYIDQDGEPSLLAGRNERNCFAFHLFSGNCPSIMISYPASGTAQGAINDVNRNGKVYAFTNRFEGMKFFCDAYMRGKE